jgi:hypothetical protein
MQRELADTIKAEQESLLTVVETAEANTKDAKAKLEQLKDQYRRLQADFDNFRSRAEAERAQTGQNVKMSVVEDLLPLVDNFELASVQVRDHWLLDSLPCGGWRAVCLTHRCRRYKGFAHGTGLLSLTTLSPFQLCISPYLCFLASYPWRAGPCAEVHVANTGTKTALGSAWTGRWGCFCR